MDTQAFPDGSGRCGNCGRAFRGSAPVGTLLRGEEVDPAKAAVVREKERFGLFGLLGGVLAFAGVPTVFLLGAFLRRQGASEYVADVFNRPGGVLTCGGIALLVIAGWYAIWAGFHVWRGFSERARHLLFSGVFVAAAGAIAGQGLPGIVGIVGGAIALLGWLLIWRTTRGKGEEASPTTPEAS